MNTSGELWSYARGNAPAQIGSMSWSCAPLERQGNAQMVASAADICESLDEVMLLISQPEIANAILECERLNTRAQLILDAARAVLSEATGRELPEWPGRDKTDTRLEG